MGPFFDGVTSRVPNTTPFFVSSRLSSAAI